VTREWRVSPNRIVMLAKKDVLLQLMICVVVKLPLVLVTREWRVSPTRIVMLAKKHVQAEMQQF